MLCCGRAPPVKRWTRSAWAAAQGVQLTYGNVLQCDCWNLVAVDSKARCCPRTGPWTMAATLLGSVSRAAALPPPPQVMERDQFYA